jgi:hypothetical protein
VPHILRLLPGRGVSCRSSLLAARNLRIFCLPRSRSAPDVSRLWERNLANVCAPFHRLAEIFPVIEIEALAFGVVFEMENLLLLYNVGARKGKHTAGSEGIFD